MKEHERKSLEELRFENYLANQKTIVEKSATTVKTNFEQ
jgi:hypothetical protein